MTETEKLAEWVRWYGAATLKMNALLAIQKNDPQLLESALKKLGLLKAGDVVKACEGDWPRGT